MLTKTNSSLFPYIGGKNRLAKKIIPLFPEHNIYIEPFCGSAAIFFKKQPSKVEVLNDKNIDIINFFDVLRNKRLRTLLIEKLTLTPYSRKLFDDLRLGKIKCKSKLNKAWRFFSVARMSHGGFKPNATAKVNNILSSQGWRYSKGSSGTCAKEVKQFRRAVKNLNYFASRLLKAYIENQDYLQVIERWDDKTSFFYMDPPYDLEHNRKYYRHCFNDQQHKKLAAAAKKIKGKIMISYYETELISELYPDKYFNKFYVKNICSFQNSGAGHTKKRVKEVLIMNYEPSTPLLDLMR